MARFNKGKAAKAQRPEESTPPKAIPILKKIDPVDGFGVDPGAEFHEFYVELDLGLREEKVRSLSQGDRARLTVEVVEKTDFQGYLRLTGFRKLI